jgi:predicted ABC-type ATPase
MPIQQPAMWLLAGPNGSGKSTFYRNHLVARVGLYVNPDEIAKTLTDIPVQRDRDVKAMELAEQQRHALIQQGETFVAETVFSHPSKVDLLREAQEAGYDVTLAFICTDDPDINVGRVQQRVQQGGHDVPTDKIGPRYERALQNLREAIVIADTTFLYDNSDIDKPHNLVAEIQHGQVVQQAATLPSWVEKTFPEGLQPYLDTAPTHHVIHFDAAPVFAPRIDTPVVYAALAHYNQGHAQTGANYLELAQFVEAEAAERYTEMVRDTLHSAGHSLQGQLPHIAPTLNALSQMAREKRMSGQWQTWTLTEVEALKQGTLTLRHELNDIAPSTLKPSTPPPTLSL